MSKQSDHIFKLIRKAFPEGTVIPEHYVNYKGTRLFFDFYLKSYNVLFEIQGRQHEEYVAHFHGDREGFLSSKRRDNLKLSYVQENSMTLVVIYHDEKITKDKLLAKIIKAQDDRLNNKK